MKKWIIKFALNYAIKLIKNWIKNNASKEVQASFHASVNKISDDSSNDFKYED